MSLGEEAHSQRKEVNGKKGRLAIILCLQMIAIEFL